MGVPLHRIKDIRLLYMADMFDDSSIEFDSPDYPPVAKGHVIAARITSENPDEVWTIYFSTSMLKIANFTALESLRMQVDKFLVYEFADVFNVISLQRSLLYDSRGVIG